MPPSAINRNAASPEALDSAGNRGNLWHADAGDDPRRADRTGPDADLYRVHARIQERLGPLDGRDVAGDHVDVEAFFQFLDRFDDVARMAMRRIHDEDIHFGVDQGCRSFVIVHADRRPDAQPASLVLARARKGAHLVDIANGDQASQFIFFVNQQQFLDFIFRQNPFSRCKRCIFRGRNQIIFRHHFSQALVVVGNEAQVALGDDALEMAVDGDGDAGDVVIVHDLAGVFDGGVGIERDRIGDDAVLAAFDFLDLASLHLDGHVLVNDADAAFLGEGDGQLAFGDGVHRRGDDGDIEMDIARQLGADIDVARQHFAVAGFEENVVESDALISDAVLHGEISRRGGGFLDIIGARVNSARRCLPLAA